MTRSIPGLPSCPVRGQWIVFAGPGHRDRVALSKGTQVKGEYVRHSFVFAVITSSPANRLNRNPFMQVRGMCLATDGQRAIVGCEDTRALIFDMHSGRLIRSLPPNPGAVTAVQCMENDDFLITAGGNKITFYSFRNEDSFAHLRPKKNRLAKHIMSHRQQFNMSNIPITCFHIARDSQMAAVASGKTVSIWQLNTPEQTTTLDGHTSIVTALSFSPNSEFVASGSEDKTVIVWGLTLSLIVTTFKVSSSTSSCLNDITLIPSIALQPDN